MARKSVFRQFPQRVPPYVRLPGASAARAPPEHVAQRRRQLLAPLHGGAGGVVAAHPALHRGGAAVSGRVSRVRTRTASLVHPRLAGPRGGVRASRGTPPAAAAPAPHRFGHPRAVCRAAEQRPRQARRRRSLWHLQLIAPRATVFCSHFCFLTT